MEPFLKELEQAVADGYSVKILYHKSGEKQLNYRLVDPYIDEASQSSVEALTATGATYFQIVSKAVIPQCLPQMLSWVLFMVETNVRNATLVGILTGTGIGYTFDVYYKMLNYNAVALVTLCIVITVIIVDLISNYVRKVIL